MKIGRIVLLLSIICCLFLASVSLVSAIDETKTIESAEDNVMDFMGEYTDEKPNIDILELTYTRSGAHVTLTLKVKGNIENRGNFDDLLSVDEEFDIDLVYYGFTLYTSDDIYYILYLNEVCNISTSTGEYNTDDFSVSADTLTVNFDLENDSETYDSLEGEAWDFKSLEIYVDLATDEEIPLVVDAGTEYEANIGETINFTGFAYGGSFPFTYEWDFGDGSTSEQKNPKHSYSESGEYTVSFTVIDSVGTTETAEATVVILSENGGNGEDGESSNVMIFATLIIIIIIVGIAAVAIILRR